jgi:hypothetical protein
MNIIIDSVEELMNSIYQQDRLLRQFKEFQQLNARGYTAEANRYIDAVFRELTELRNAQCYFSKIIESYAVDVATIEGIINLINELLKPIIQISDLLAIECEAVYLYFAADSIKKNLITIMLQPLRTILRASCSGGFNHGQEQGSVSKKHEYSCLYSALWQ